MSTEITSHKMNIFLDKISSILNVEKTEILRQSILMWLSKKRQEISRAIKSILEKYRVKSVDELEKKISKGEVPEHPTWEDLITAENLLQSLKELEEIINDLQELG